MQDLTDDERKLVLGEFLMDELKAIREGISALPTRTEFAYLKDDVIEIKGDIKIIKAAVTNHEQRLNSLESSVGFLQVAIA